MPQLCHQLICLSAKRAPNQVALQHKNGEIDYKTLKTEIDEFASFLLRKGLENGQRVAIYLPKQFEAVIAMFATSLAGAIFVPINPLLKPNQVKHILIDSQATILITSQSRHKQLQSTLSGKDSLKTVVLTNCKEQKLSARCYPWPTANPLNIRQDSLSALDEQRNSQELAAILYTSGSTGQPKGVVLSHANLIEGAKSVSQYLGNTESDRILAVLPFSFDYGLSQLTTAFLTGATVVMLEYLLPRDVVNAVTKYKITGLAAVPPLWIQLAEFEWPEDAKNHLRYFTNSGGAMPQTTLTKLVKLLPNTLPFLMYGLTEAFRSTYLEPSQVSHRPLSMGKAIPKATILVINSKGEICEPDEPGELVHLGVHVAQGYWLDKERTEQKFRPLPAELRQQYGNGLAVWSGDTVKKDEQGYLYFIGRQDDMIKSSGYRISPAELEDAIFSHPQVREVAAIGIPDDRLGQAILLVIQPKNRELFEQKEKLQKGVLEKDFLKKDILRECKKRLPNYMQPHRIVLVDSLPRNPNGKINRSLLNKRYQ